MLPPPTSRRHAPRASRTRRLALGSLTTLLVAATLAALGSPSATAITTLTPIEAGPTGAVVRDDSLTVTVDRGAQTFFRASNGSFAPVSGVLVPLRGCRGDNPAGTNTSPRVVVQVTGPGGQVVASETSQVRDVSLGGALANPPYPFLRPQPAPSNTNYRGDVPEAAAPHGMSATVDLAGRPAGTYTVTTTTTNTYRVGSGFLQTPGPCQVGTPTGATSVAPGPVVETTTFEYRPWQVTFADVFGKGSVRVNTTPREHRFSVDGNSSTIRDGATAQTFYSFQGAFLLPTDPAACAASAAACLPTTAIPCDPAAGCQPRLMVISSPSTEADADGLAGVFDLETRAFIATATVDGTTRVLTSLGTANDALYRDVLAQLGEAAAAQGVDLPALLATEVLVGDGQNETSLSLLNGLQIQPSATRGGVRLRTGATVQAGVLLDIYSSLRLSGGACQANASSSSSAQDRYTRAEDNGYTITKTDYLPRVPAAGPLGAIAGGPVYHIKGRFGSDGASTLVNTASAVIGVDTATNEPNGYPVWVQPFLSAPMHVASPRTMEFVGTATWSASETPVASGCLVVDFMLGTGVAVFDNPLPVGLGTLIDYAGEPSPQAAALSDAVDTVVADAVASVTSNPQVDQVLGTVLEALALPQLP